jgi:hypothetical protein
MSPKQKHIWRGRLQRMGCLVDAAPRWKRPARREHDAYRYSGRFSSPGRPAGACGGVAGRPAVWGRASGRAICSGRASGRAICFGRASGRAACSGLASGFAADCGRAIGSDFGSYLRTSSGRLSSAPGRFSSTAGRPGSAARFGSTRAPGAGAPEIALSKLHYQTATSEG